MGSQTSFIKQTHGLLHQDSVPKLFWSEEQPSTSSNQKLGYHHPTHTICKPLCYYCRIDKFRIPCVSKREPAKDNPLPTARFSVPGRQIPDSSRDGVAYPRPLRPLFPTFYRRDIFSQASPPVGNTHSRSPALFQKRFPAALTPDSSFSPS